MSLVAYLMAAFLGILGLIFIIGFQGMIVRLVIGIILLLASAALVILAKMRPKQTRIDLVQKIDLSGDVNLEHLRCKSCGAELTNKSVTVKAGAVFVHCEYCGATYQIEEAPKW